MSLVWFLGLAGCCLFSTMIYDEEETDAFLYSLFMVTTCTWLIQLFCIFLLDLTELHLYTVDEHVMLTLMQGSSNVHQIYYISVFGKTDSTAV